MQGLTWSFVELTSHFAQMGLRMHRKVGPLRKVLSQQAIGVLVRPELAALVPKRVCSQAMIMEPPAMMACRQTRKWPRRSRCLAEAQGQPIASDP